MSSTLRLLQRLQRWFVLWLRPGEPEPDARDLNLRVPESPEKGEFRPGQLPPDPKEERRRRWRARQHRSRAGPWQMK
jgi:hypothetical protein